MHRENSVHYKKFFKYNHFIRNSFCGVLNSDLSKAIIVVNKNLKIKIPHANFLPLPKRSSKPTTISKVYINNS